MIGPLTAVRRLTSTATGLATWPVRTGVSVASTAVHGALHLVKPGGAAVKQAAAQARAATTGSPGTSTPEPVRVPTPPDPAVKLVTQQDEAPAGKAPAKKAPAKRAPSKKAAVTAPAKAAQAAQAASATPKPAQPRKKKASEVPLKSEPTPTSAAPLVPEGPDVLPGEEGATGLAEAQPLLDEGTAKAVLSEADTLRRAAE